MGRRGGRRRLRGLCRADRPLGSATFAGYLTLDDTSTWLALADNALQHGRSVAGLAPSTYSVVLHDYLSTGYPLGSFLPLGIGQELTRQDAAWLFQPQIAFMAAILGLSIYSLSAPLLRARSLRAAVAFLGAQPALLFGYAFWSGIKEVTVAALVAALAALVASGAAGGWRVRDLLPVAAISAAVLDSLAVTGAIWLAAPIVLGGFLLVVVGPRRGSVPAAALAAMTLVLSIPALTIAQVFVRVANAGGSGSITSTSEIGNLLHPLSDLQLLGIWPVADFRLRPSDIQVTYVLVGVVVLAGLAGLAAALRRRAWGIPLYLGTVPWFRLLRRDRARSRSVTALPGSSGRRWGWRRRVSWPPAPPALRSCSRQDGGWRAASRPRRSPPASSGRTRSPTATSGSLRGASSPSCRRSATASPVTARR